MKLITMAAVAALIASPALADPIAREQAKADFHQGRADAAKAQIQKEDAQAQAADAQDSASTQQARADAAQADASTLQNQADAAKADAARAAAAKANEPREPRGGPGANPERDKGGDGKGEGRRARAEEDQKR